MIYYIDAIDSPREQGAFAGISYLGVKSCVPHPYYGNNIPLLKNYHPDKDLGREGWNFDNENVRLCSSYRTYSGSYYYPNEDSTGRKERLNIFRNVNSSQLTLSFVVRLTGQTFSKTNDCVFAQECYCQKPAYYRWAICIDPTSKKIYYYNASTVKNRFIFNYISSVGFHVFCVVQNSNMMTLYDNGVLVSTISIGDNVMYSKNADEYAFACGAATMPNEECGFLGTYYSLLAYNRCLTADEIMVNYQYDKSRYDK